VGDEHCGREEVSVRVAGSAAGVGWNILAAVPIEGVTVAASEDQVIDTFVQDGRITTMPARRSRRLVVLDYVARRFEIGKHYDEQAVNGILRPVFDDYVALRRYLVDEGFLDREQGEYWRSGGTTEPTATT
jgi:hypothetical protein